MLFPPEIAQEWRRLHTIGEADFVSRALPQDLTRVCYDITQAVVPAMKVSGSLQGKVRIPMAHARPAQRDDVVFSQTEMVKHPGGDEGK